MQAEGRRLCATGTGQSLHALQIDLVSRDESRGAGRRSKDLKIAIFGSLSGVMDGISALSLEIRRSPRTFLLVREVSDLQLNF